MSIKRLTYLSPLTNFPLGARAKITPGCDFRFGSCVTFDVWSTTFNFTLFYSITTCSRTLRNSQYTLFSNCDGLAHVEGPEKGGRAGNYSQARSLVASLTLAISPVPPLFISRYARYNRRAANFMYSLRQEIINSWKLATIYYILPYAIIVGR